MDNETIVIVCTMKSRWIPCFVSMLRRMEFLGKIGSSRIVSIFSDGDGDFRPRFTVLPNEPKKILPVIDIAGDFSYDADGEKCEPAKREMVIVNESPPKGWSPQCFVEEQKESE